MLAVVGTVPEEDFPLIYGRVSLSGDGLTIEGLKDRIVPINRGTPALLGAALKAAETIGRAGPAEEAGKVRPTGGSRIEATGTTALQVRVLGVSATPRR